MKNFLFKSRLGVLLTVCVFAFGLGLTESSAQKIVPSSNPAEVKPEMVDGSDAMTRLNQEIGALEAFLQGKLPDQLDYKLKYYNCVYQSIEQGEAVPTAIDVNYMRFVPGFTDSPTVEIPNNLPLALWQGYYADIVLLLKK